MQHFCTKWQQNKELEWVFSTFMQMRVECRFARSERILGTKQIYVLCKGEQPFTQKIPSAFLYKSGAEGFSSSLSQRLFLMSEEHESPFPNIVETFAPPSESLRFPGSLGMQTTIVCIQKVGVVSAR
jgi:hypothetical protein